jgi:hypothetical protein
MPRENCHIEPNTLTHAEHIRRAYTTQSGQLMPGVSTTDYLAAYAAAQDRDRFLGIDPQLRSPEYA